MAREGADQGQPVLGPRRGYVQPAFAAVTQERTPLVAHPAVRVLAVADRQDDRVSFISLNPLEVLDEERLRRVFREERFQPASPARIAEARQLRPQRGVDSVGVLDAEGDYSERFRWVVARVLDDELNHLVDLGIDRSLLARARALGHDHVAQAVVAEHAWEGRERAAVYPAVREGNQPLVAAAVVPGQRRRRQ